MSNPTSSIRNNINHDSEKTSGPHEQTSSADASTSTDLELGEKTRRGTFGKKFHQISKVVGAVETSGIAPIPEELRTDKRLYQFFCTFFSLSIVLLTFSVGVVGPTYYSLSCRDAVITLTMGNLVACSLPSYCVVFGPKLGMRTMIQARFSFGYYVACLPAILNVITLLIFVIVCAIVGGQLLASLSDHLTAAVGIVIISLISLVVSFFGYRFMHWYGSVAWIPTVLVYIVMLCIGAKNIEMSTSPAATAPQVLSFFGTVLAASLPWCSMAADYGVYHDVHSSNYKLFIYTFTGMFLGTETASLLGVLFAAAPKYSPYTADVGTLFSAILIPDGANAHAVGGGKFLIVLLALSVPSVISPMIYSFGSSFMTVSPLIAKIPRAILAVVATAICIPVAIVGASSFYTVLVSALMIGYWITVFIAILLVEHFVFRSGGFSESSYLVSDWDNKSIPRRASVKLDDQELSRARAGLPLGLAALVSFCIGIGMSVVSMNQSFFAGPIGKRTGDIGIIVGFVSTCTVYTILRSLERYIMTRKG